MTLMRYVLVPFLALALTTSNRNVHGQEVIVGRSENRIDFERFVALSESANLDESKTTELLTFFGSPSNDYNESLYIPIAALPHSLCTGETSKRAIDTWISGMLKKLMSNQRRLKDKLADKTSAELIAVALDQEQYSDVRIAATLFLDRLNSADAYDCAVLLLLLSDENFFQILGVEQQANQRELPNLRREMLSKTEFEWIEKLLNLNALLVENDSALDSIKGGVKNLAELAFTIPFQLRKYGDGNEKLQGLLPQISDNSYPQRLRREFLSCFLRDIRGRFETLSADEISQTYHKYVPSCNYMLSVSLCCDNLEEFLSARAYAFDWHRFSCPTNETCTTIDQPGMVDIERILTERRGKLQSANTLSLIHELNGFGEKFRAHAVKELLTELR